MADYGFLGKFLKGAGNVVREEGDDVARLAAQKAEQEAMESGADILGQSPSMAKMNDEFATAARQQDVTSAFTDPLSARNSASVFDEALPWSQPVSPDKALVPRGQKMMTPNEVPSSINLPMTNGQKGLSTIEESGLPALRSEAGLPATGGGGRGGFGDIIDVTPSAAGSSPEVFDKMSFLQKYGKKAAIGAGTAGLGVLGYNALKDDAPATQAPAVTVAPTTNVTKPDDTQPDTKQDGAPTPLKAQPTSIKAKNDPTADMNAVLAAQANQFKDTEAGLRDAQDRENRTIFNNQLGKSANLIGSSIAGVAPAGQELFDDNIKQAGQITVQHQALMDKANNDPKSGLSVALRQQLKSLGVNAPESMSATDLVKVVPGAQALFTANQNRAEKAREFGLRHEENMLKAQQMKLDHSKNAQDKKDKDDLSRILRLGPKIGGDIGQSGAIGKERQSLNNIQHAKAILSGDIDLNDVPDVQVVEIAKALDRVISGGSPTVSGTHEFTPQNAKRWLAQKRQEITSTPGGAGQAGVLKIYSDMLDRQANTSKQNMAKAAARILAPISDLRNHPQVLDILAANELPEDLFNYMPQRQAREDVKNGVTNPVDKKTSEQTGNKQLAVDPQIISAKVKAFMAKNPQVTDPKQAEQILKEHGRL